MRPIVWVIPAALLLSCARDPAPPAPPAAAPTPTAPPPPRPRARAPARARRRRPPPVPLRALTAADHAGLREADAACADCHPDEAAAWAASPMGQSFRPIAAAPAAPYTHPAERLDPATGHRYRQHDGAFEVTADPHHALTRRPAWVFGSGTHVHTLAWADGDRLYQIPLSWYASERSWDFSPGIEPRLAELGFYREITTGCLACHAETVTARPGADVRLEAPPTGAFGCLRCHGDGRAHVAGRLAGQPAPIIRPDRLPPARAADVCALCHFEGTVRVLRPGHEWTDFLPGGRLADIAAIFVRTEARTGFGSADQADRLALSACAQKTPAMTCTTCHAPHPTGARAAADRSAPCRDCHASAPAHPCAGPAGPDCAGCHMDEGPTANIPHTQGIDHHIRVRPTPRAPATNDSPLVWAARPEREPTDPDHQLLLGRAYAEAWRSDGQPEDARRAARWLGAGLAARPDRADGWIALAAMRRLQGDLPGLRQAAERAYALDPADRRHATLTGWARLQQGDAAAALEALDRAAAAADSAEIETLRARALATLARPADAEAAARRAVELQPTAAEARLALAGLARQRGALDLAADHFTAAAAWAPADVRAWLQLGRVEAERRRWPESLAAYTQAERAAGPDDLARDLALLGRAEALLQTDRPAEARAIGDLLRTREVPLPGLASLMGRLHLIAGELQPALGALRAAVQLDPTDEVARAALAEAERRAKGP
ncbi:MAG: tetratricopeptide repeat protein [Myxococcales bacterium]|nr:tetratricopeptide repeat protein [Myxococcales bacterium]